jgi:hypothetical protein
MKRLSWIVLLSVVAAGLLMISSLIAQDSGSKPSPQELEIEPLEDMGPTSYLGSVEAVADAESSKSVGSANTQRDDTLKGDSWRPRRVTVIVEGPSGVVHLKETHDLPANSS